MTGEITVLRWPEDSDDAGRLVASGVAVLYLVDDGAEAPAIASCLEDWVRVPSGDRDVAHRLAGLARRVATHLPAPTVDTQNRLHYLGEVVELPPTEARLLAALTRRFGDLVIDDELRGAVEPEAIDSLRPPMSHLRARLRPLGLQVQRVRGRGYRVRPATTKMAT